MAPAPEASEPGVQAASKTSGTPSRPNCTQFTPAPPAVSGNTSFWDAVSSYERQLVIAALQNAGGVQKKAAEILQIKPTTLHEMMKRLGISAEVAVSNG